MQVHTSITQNIMIHVLVRSTKQVLQTLKEHCKSLNMLLQHKIQNKYYNRQLLFGRSYLLAKYKLKPQAYKYLGLGGLLSEEFLHLRFRGLTFSRAYFFFGGGGEFILEILSEFYYILLFLYVTSSSSYMHFDQQVDYQFNAS